MTPSTERLILEETVESRVIFLIVLACFTLFLGAIFGILGKTAGTEDELAPGAIVVLVAVFGFFTWNYHAITIRLTDRRLTAGYGVFKSSRALADVVSVERYARPWYYGYGTRYTILKGKLGWMHNAIGKPLVLVTMKDGKGKPFAFSCDDPDRIIKAVMDAKSALPMATTDLY